MHYGKEEYNQHLNKWKYNKSFKNLELQVEYHKCRGKNKNFVN